MENAKVSMKKGKSIKIFLSYFTLVILVILLFAPMLTRIFFKEKAPEPKKDEVIVLSCEKQDESVSSSFVNGEPRNISYHITGNYELTSADETEVLTTSAVFKKLVEYKAAVYDETKGVSEIKFNTSVVENTIDYELIFNNITNQEEYFRSQGFSCNRVNK